MSQSEAILASLIAGFVAYLAIAGKLGSYWSILTGGGTGSQTSGASGPADPSIIAHGGTSPAIASPTTKSPGMFDPGGLLNPYLINPGHGLPGLTIF